MKFTQRLDWERRESPITLSNNEFGDLIEPVFKNSEIDQYKIISSGLANTNFYFKLKGQSQGFLLRLYMRDRNAIKQEILLSSRFGQSIPMPEFMYFSDKHPKYTYAIQKWVEGKHLYEVIDRLPSTELKSLASNLARQLSDIASIRFPVAGFFNETLEITPFGKSKFNHPFVDYIQDCLQAYTRQWLGDVLADKLWEFVVEHQDYFPSLTSPCLVHGDFNQDNIIIDEKTLKLAVLIDWEFAYSGSYLFDIGTLFRFDVPEVFKKAFIQTYETAHGQLDKDWQKMIKVQDLANFVGLLNVKDERPNLIRTIKLLIRNTLENIS